MGLSMKAYQEMAYAAERSGVDIRQVDVAIKTMSRNMVTAGAITNKLGIDFQKLKSLSPERQFAEVGRRIAAIQNPAERVAVATEIFGRQGARIAEMAKDFERLAAAANMYGVILDEGAIKKAEQFNDMMTTLSLRIRAAFVNSIPAIENFGTVIATWFAYITDVGGAINRMILGLFSAETFEIWGRNAKTFMTWFEANWRDLAYNLGETLSAAVMNSFENIQRLITAAKDWALGRGWNFEKVGLGEGANLREIPDLVLESVPALDQLAADLTQAAMIRDGALVAAYNNFTDATRGLGDEIKSVGDTVSTGNTAPDRAKGLQAALFGSVEAASAVARLRSGRDDKQIARDQLTVLRSIDSKIGDLDIDLEEVSIA
jgi:hypothetical protein